LTTRRERTSAKVWRSEKLRPMALPTLSANRKREVRKRDDALNEKVGEKNQVSGLEGKKGDDHRHNI